MMPSPASARARAPWISAALLASALASDVHVQSPNAFERAWQQGTPATITGELTAIVADDFERGRSEMMHFIRDVRTGRSFRIHLDEGVPAHWRSGSTMTLTGRTSESGLYVLAASTDPNATSSPSSTFSAPTTSVVDSQNTLVMVANFRDASVACSVDAISDTMFTNSTGLSVDGLYRDASHGQVAFSGQVAGVFSLDAASTDACDLSGWAAAVDRAATTAGVNVSAYSRKMYVMPPNSCPGAGFGTLGGSTSVAWVFSCGVRGLYAHELGHNLGMDHASTLQFVYGDTTDPMALSENVLRGFNAPHRHQMGWLEDGNAPILTAGGLYEIAPLSLDPVAASAPLALRVPKWDTNDYYYLSYRVRDGFDRFIDGSYVERVSVHRYKGDGSSSRTHLVATLATGEGFEDPANGLTVTALNLNTGAATVMVDLVPVCVARAPLTSISPAAQSGASGATLSYRVTVTSQDSPECAVTTYMVRGTAPAGWVTSVSADALPITPGSSVETTLTLSSPPGTPAATYSIGVDVADAISGPHAAVAAATYSVLSCVRAVPSVSGSPLIQAGLSGTTLVYGLTVTNRDGVGCAPSSFEMTAPVPTGWSKDLSNATLTLAPGESRTLSLSLTSMSTAPPGSVTIAVNALDPRAVDHSGSVGLTYTVDAPADTIPPTTPSGLTAVANQKLKRVELSWNASQDAVGVSSYRVMRNGVDVGQATTNSWADTAWVAGASYTYAVAARDAEGNASATSASVTIALPGSGKKR